MRESVHYMCFESRLDPDLNELADPDPGRPNLSPKKEKKLITLCLKSSLWDWGRLLDPECPL
jgi:hypothetical protein